MDSDAVNILIGKFSQDLVSFVLEYCEYPSCPRENYGDNSPKTPFEESVGIVLIALIKGEWKSDIKERAMSLIDEITTRNRIREVLRNYGERFFKVNESTSNNVLKVIAVSIMCPLYKYKQIGYVSVCALQAIKDLLQTLERVEFVRKGGLDELRKYANITLGSNEELKRIYNDGNVLLFGDK